MMASFPQSMIIAAHDHCTANRAELMTSEVCACLYCLKTFPPAEIEFWVEELSEDTQEVPEEKWTAMCPYCPVDAVIGSASGYPVGDRSFLKAMHEYLF